jgi:AcrR family transcriptional regulator
MTDTDAPEAAQTGEAVPRSAWLDAAMAILVARGVEKVKVLTLSERLGVSRSSFYWHFKDRQALLGELLDAWEAKNTAGIVGRCAAPAETITGAICNLFHCFVDRELFDHRLDFAVREWARRSADAKARVDRADAARVDAIRRMFERYGYAGEDAAVRARVVYLVQIGYYALGVAEDIERRLEAVPHYLETFTGRPGRPEEIAELAAFSRAVAQRDAASGQDCPEAGS